MTISNVELGLIWLSLAIFSYACAIAFADGFFESARMRAGPEPHKLARLKNHLETLRESGTHRSSVTCSQPHSPRFFQLRKIAVAKGGSLLELCIPEADWSGDYMAAIEDYCVEHSIPHRLAKEHPQSSNNTFYADCGENLTLAYELGAAIWTKIFGLHPEATCTFQLAGTSAWGPADVSASHLDGRAIETEEETPPEDEMTLIQAVYALFAVIAFYGLGVSALLTHDDPGDWALTIAGKTLSGSISSLGFLRSMFS